MLIAIPTEGKLYLLCSLGLSALVFSGSLNPYSLTYTLKGAIFELDLYRPLTAMLYLGRVGPLLVLHVVLAVLAFSKAGPRVWGDSKADFVWMFTVVMGLLTVFSTFSSMYFFGNAFLMAVLTMWAVRAPTEQLSLFSVGLPLLYFPFLAGTVMTLLGSSIKNYMVGMLVGLLLGVIKSPNFIDKHGDLIPTPAFLTNLFQPRREERRAPEPRVEAAPAADGGHFRGQGYRIG
jgi:hypothetical protein